MQKTVLFIFLILFCACQDEQVKANKTDDQTIKAAVFLSAGENYPLFNELGIPTFFNLGRIIKPNDTELQTIILSERKSKGSKINIIPMAMFSFEKDTSQFEFIISTTANHESDRLGLNYNDFLLKNYHTQMNIENWFLSQCPENACRNFKWDNNYKALLKINSSQI